MKKFFSLLFLCVIIVSSEAFCQNSSKPLSTEALKFRNNLTSFLHEEGFVPKLNEDGNRIDFKREGTSYSITMAGSVPVKLTIEIEGFTIKDANYLALLLACNEVNRDMYYVKSYVTDYSDEGSLNISIEMPCHTAEEFRYVFFDCLNTLQSARNQIQESYTKNQNELESGASNAIVDIKNPTVSIIPNNNKGLTITRVQITATQTIIDLIYDNSINSSGWVTISPNTQIISVDNAKKYTLLKAEGIPLEPTKHYFSTNNEKLSFRLIFPALPSNTSRFNLIESERSSWKFYGIRLK